jgi:hypothetical protein
MSSVVMSATQMSSLVEPIWAVRRGTVCRAIRKG